MNEWTSVHIWVCALFFIKETLLQGGNRQEILCNDDFSFPEISLEVHISSEMKKKKNHSWAANCEIFQGAMIVTICLIAVEQMGLVWG